MQYSVSAKWLMPTTGHFSSSQSLATNDVIEVPVQRVNMQQKVNIVTRPPACDSWAQCQYHFDIQRALAPIR